MRVLVTGWPSFRHGEATAGDVLSMSAVHRALVDAGVDGDLAWSPVFRPGALSITGADPSRYTDVVFTCGPLRGEQIRWLHRRFAGCRRIAAGVSVIDHGDPAVTGFHHVFPRDDGTAATVDLSAATPTSPTPVIGVTFAPGQPEYGGNRRHQRVHEQLAHWLTGLDCAPVTVDTRLDATDHLHCRTPDQLVSLLARLDVVISTRLHGLVLGLGAGTPVLAVDPVAEGGKVSAQATALDWPATIGARAILADDGADTLGHWWRWCRSPAGRARALRCAAKARPAATGQIRQVVGLMRDGRR